jgi:hypothetical protein
MLTPPTTGVERSSQVSDSKAEFYAVPADPSTRTRRLPWERLMLGLVSGAVSSFNEFHSALPAALQLGSPACAKRMKQRMRLTQTILRLFLMFALLSSAGASLSQSTSYTIAGTVVNSKSGALLPEARVFLTDVKDPKNTQSQLTSDDGRFAFNVPAGKYALRAARHGYISANYNQHEQFSTAIVTGVGLETENLILKLDPTAAIFGRVLDENGDPIRDAQVALWYQDHSTGVSRIQSSQRSISDDQGTYEFSPLDSGTYFLSVSAQPWYAVHPPSVTPEGSSQMPVMVDRSLDVVYPTTYYAGATESEDATPIPIRGGDRQELDLRLLPVPSLHVIFRAGQQSAGENQQQAFSNPPEVFSNPVFQKRVFDDMEFQSSEAQMIAPNVYEVTTAPGKYMVRFFQPHGAQVSEVEVSQDHQEFSAAAGEAFSIINVSVHLLDDATIPDQLLLGFVDQPGRGVGFQRVSAQGEAHFSDIAPGTYDFSIGSPGKTYSIVRVTAEGHTTSGRTLKVAPGANLSVDVWVASGSGRIEGVVKQGDKPVAGAMVVLVPKHPDANRDLFRRDQSDLDGTFSLQSVIPGTYTVIAIADGWDLDWSQPAVIAHYAQHGQTIEVPAKASRPLTLPAPVEVQTK